MHDVKVYSTPTCPWCTKVKDYLTEKKVSFASIDISQNREAAMSLVIRSGQRVVPIVEIDGEFIVGFDKEKIDAKLGL